MPGIATIGHVVATSDITNNGTTTSLHFAGRGSPTVVTNSGAGAGVVNATVTFDANANDSGGILTLVAGTTPATAATICTVTFGTAYATAPHFSIAPANSSAALLSGTSMVFGTSAAGTFTLTSGSVGLVESTTYKWSLLWTQ